MNYPSNQKKGFTLIEMLVTVFVFVSVVTMASGIFISSLKAQRQTLAYQQLLDQTSYIAEHMSRAIRMAKKDLLGTCLTNVGAKYNYETNATRDRIRFLNYQNKCQEFSLQESQLRERLSTDSTAGNFGTALSLTSDDLQVISFKLGSPSSWDQNDNDQPKVTVFLKIEGGEQSIIKFQTTISQRNLDVWQ